MVIPFEKLFDRHFPRTCLDYWSPPRSVCAIGWLLHLRIFQPLVEPAEELALPEHGVLRFGDEMAFVREEEEAAGDSLHLGDIVSLHAFGIGDAEVVAAMDHENRGVPVAHEMVR